MSSHIESSLNEAVSYTVKSGQTKFVMEFIHKICKSHPNLKHSELVQQWNKLSPNIKLTLPKAYESVEGKKCENKECENDVCVLSKSGKYCSKCYKSQDQNRCQGINDKGKVCDVKCGQKSHFCKKHKNV